MKKLFAILLVSIIAITVLTACGGGRKETETPETVEQIPMDTGDLVTLVFKDLGVDMTVATDILVNLIDGDGNRAITFKLAGKECTYVVNSYDGTVVSKEIPEGAIEEALSPPIDPVEIAINAVFDNFEGSREEAEDISAYVDDTTVIVEFYYYGDYYTYYYDLEEGQLLY